MKVINGDLLLLGIQGEFDVIVHGCNCFNTMGAGIAASMKRRFPSAYEADCATEKGSRDKLGTYSTATVVINKGGDGNSSRNEIGHPLTIVNAYTQYHWRSKNRICLADYDAIRSVFRAIKADFSGKKIGYPLIGAGLAGGDWATIRGIIEEELVNENHTLVKYAQPNPKVNNFPSSFKFTNKTEHDVFSALSTRVTAERLRKVLQNYAVGDTGNGTTAMPHTRKSKFTKNDLGLICNLLSRDVMDDYYREDDTEEKVDSISGHGNSSKI